jgi:hypothetical protein
VKVYVVTHHFYEGSIIHGVYSTLEKATDYLNSLANHGHKDDPDYEFSWDPHEDFVLRETCRGGYTGDCYVIKEYKLDERVE